ncbi:hypothetical protein G8764_02425 [Pseudomaricurvus alcaniphilus]|uniref:hypothetical protein n=1 Tax=Pseudomaricurvus alcaniphilus TaxID=1166482 RepID=UPI001408EC5F|nr:hypothetical protein [Pseudomaricurvus alcaniphilus]NHN36145.1 hypothetical protein [Pseudomaricurvus alcaniphilus]
MDESTPAIKIARINAWQAVIVALIGGVAGVAGTAGLKYYDYSKRLAEQEQTIQALEQTLAAYEQDLGGNPLVALRTAKVNIGLPECLQRLSEWHKSAAARVRGSGGSQHSTSYDGYFISQFGGYTVRAACPSAAARTAVVSVAKLYRRADDVGITEVVEVADEIVATLQL